MMNKNRKSLLFHFFFDNFLLRILNILHTRKEKAEGANMNGVRLEVKLSFSGLASGIFQLVGSL